MAVLEFEDLKFSEKDGLVEACFMDSFYFDLDKKDLDEIGKFKITFENKIEFEGKEAKVRRLFNNLISVRIKSSLKSKDGRKAIYVHDGPLIGGQAFGILDSDTNCVELRPITGCNLNCMFCSVDEKLKKGPCYIVDLDLLVSEARLKKSNPKLMHS